MTSKNFVLQGRLIGLEYLVQHIQDESVREAMKNLEIERRVRMLEWSAGHTPGLSSRGDDKVDVG